MLNLSKSIAICTKYTLLAHRYIPVVALATLLCGCSIISGNRPIHVTATDRELVVAAEEKLDFNIPLITYSLDGRPVAVYKVAFDGTMNDATRVSVGERKTVVAHIASRVGARYYPGPGMQNPYFRNWLDGLFGFTSESIAQRAKTDFFEQVKDLVHATPNVEIRVFVTGFSRGAAIARHFMNIVEQDWASSHAGAFATDSAPYFYALLYDTVSTGQMDTLQLALPTSLDYLVHMVAKDEPRSLFVPVIDGDDQEATVDQIPGIENRFSPDRVNRLVLPGSHSDLGTAYRDGIGDIYLQMAEKLLYKMDLLSQNCWESHHDPLAHGKHDSRGILDLLSGRAAPNSDQSVKRSFYMVSAKPRSEKRNANIGSRLSTLSLANTERGSWSMSIKTQMAPPVLTVKRQGEELKVLAFVPTFIDASSFKLSLRDGFRRLDYRFLAPFNEGKSSLVLSDDIWNRLKEGQTMTLSVGILQKNGQAYLAAHVDDILATDKEATVKSGPQVQMPASRCKRDAEGHSVSPIRAHIFQAQ